MFRKYFALADGNELTTVLSVYTPGEPDILFDEARKKICMPQP